MEYLIFDCANNELYSRCLHIVTVCACAEVEVPTLSKRWQHPMAEISGGAILPEGGIIPHFPLYVFSWVPCHGLAMSWTRVEINVAARNISCVADRT